MAVLREHRERCQERAAALGVVLLADGFVFSEEPNGSTFKIPESVTQRYDRLARRPGIATTLRKLRHYSATELIIAGVDIRTVAGRLGHAGGGTTTLRTYTAWVSEADQPAAASFATRMPPRPAQTDPHALAHNNPRHPYEIVAADLTQRVDNGDLTADAPMPTATELAAEHDAREGVGRYRGRKIGFNRSRERVDIRHGDDR